MIRIFSHVDLCSSALFLIFTLRRGDVFSSRRVVIVSQRHCEQPHLHCSHCLPSLSPLSLFPAPRRSVPLGLRSGHKKVRKKEPTTSKYWLALRTARFLPTPERLKARYCSPRSQRPVAPPSSCQRRNVFNILALKPQTVMFDSDFMSESNTELPFKKKRKKEENLKSEAGICV